MSNTIDILCVIDAVSLANAVSKGTVSPGSVDNPTSLGAWASSDAYIYMITESAFVVSDQAQSELNISCNVGDNVRWMITNPADGVNYSCILYNFAAGSGATLLTQPVMLPLQIQQATNNPQNPSSAIFVNYTDATWQSTVLAAGSVQYTWSFQMYNQAQQLIGCFCWDPFISISI